MIEYVDIYDEFKNNTGKVKIRHEFLDSGEYSLGVQAIIINSLNQILISKRSEHKEVYPLMWECNGGQVSAGESGLDAIIREIKEELGINLDINKAILFKTVKKEHKFKDLYLFYQDIDINDIIFMDNEVVDVKWVTINEYMDMFNKCEIVSNVDFNKDDYNKCIEIIRGKYGSI